MNYSIYNNLIAKLVPRSGKDEFQFYQVDASGNLSPDGSVFLDESVIDFAWGRAPSSTKKRELNGTAKPHITNDSVIALLLSGDIVSISSHSRTVVRYEVKIKLTHFIGIEENTIWGLSKGNLYKVGLDGKSTKVQVPEFKSIVVKSGSVYIGTSSGLLIGKINKNAFDKEKEIKTGFEVLSVEVQDSVVIGSSLSKAVLVHAKLSKELIIGEGVKIQVAGNIYIINDDSLKVLTPTGDYIKTINTSHQVDYVFEIDGTNYVSWHDGVDMHVQKFTEDTDSISFQNGSSVKPKNSTMIHVEENVKLLDAKTVESQLHDKLSKNKLNEGEITQLCTSLHNDDDVKQIVSTLPHEYVERLFSVMNTNLPVWLKWILLIHGNLIAKSATSVKDLQQNLRSNVETMSHLYAIKGKLQLLQLQSQIRDTSIDNDITTTIEDETMIYANGEVDELNRL